MIKVNTVLGEFEIDENHKGEITETNEPVRMVVVDHLNLTTFNPNNLTDEKKEKIAKDLGSLIKEYNVKIKL